MKLVSMKIDAKAREEKYAESVAIDRPAYPYGLEVRLDKEALEKLGLADALPKAGQAMKLEATVDVTNVHESDSANGGKDCSLTLQITALALAATKQDKDAAGALYDDTKGNK